MAKPAPEYTIFELYKGKVQVKFYEKSHQYWVSVNGSPFKRKSGVTTFIGIKDKSKALGIWQQQMTCDYLFDLLDKKIPFDHDKAVEAVIQHELFRDKAADIGKEIHAWCEHYIKRKLKIKGYEKLPEIPNFPEAITGVDSFLAWEKKHKVKWISSERVIYSIKGDYVGTMDFEAEIDGIVCAGDFKSSNGLYNSVRAQTAAYGKASEEEAGKKLYKGRWAIRLSKYTEEEYIAKENRKKEVKKIMARIQGKEYKEYPIKPYQVFEAKFLDDEKTHYDRDYAAFINCKELYRWDQETDSFTQGDAW